LLTKLLSSDGSGEGLVGMALLAQEKRSLLSIDGLVVSEAVLAACLGTSSLVSSSLSKEVVSSTTTGFLLQHLAEPLD